MSALRPEVQQLHAAVKDFVRSKVLPLEEGFTSHAADPAARWLPHPDVERLKSEAKAAGLWNLFLPVEADPEKKYGAGELNGRSYRWRCSLAKIAQVSRLLSSNPQDR